MLCLIFFILMALLIIVGDKVDKQTKTECLNCKKYDCSWCGKIDIY